MHYCLCSKHRGAARDSDNATWPLASGGAPGPGRALCSLGDAVRGPEKALPSRPWGQAEGISWRGETEACVFVGFWDAAGSRSVFVCVQCAGMCCGKDVFSLTQSELLVHVAWGF